MFELSQQGGREQVTGLDMATSTLLDDFQVVLAQDPAVLPGSLALARARALLRLGEQLLAVTAVAVRDVELRELFVLDDTGSTRSWLRTQPAGEGRHATLARQLAAHLQVQAAVLSGSISAATRQRPVRATRPAPDEVGEDQIVGVPVPELLTGWTGAQLAEELLTEQLLGRREHAAAVLTASAADRSASPAARLEPVFVLLGHSVTPAHLRPSLRVLIDALLPEQLAPTARDDTDAGYLRLRKMLRGWDLTGHLDDKTGQRLHDRLHAHQRRTDHNEPDHREPVDQTEPTGDAEPEDAATGPEAGEPAEEQAPRSRARCLHDAFAALLTHAASVQPGTGQPRPAQLLIVTTLAAAHGHPGSYQAP